MRGFMIRSIRRNGRALCLGTLLAAGVPSAIWAAEASPDTVTLHKELEQSIKMIDALAARVKELESKLASIPAAAPAAPPPVAAAPVPPPVDAARLQAVEQQINQIETANAARQGDDTGLPVHGFADVDIGNHNPFHAYEKGASLNNLDLYLTPKLGGKWLSLFELNFEVDFQGNVGVDIDRGQLGYQFCVAAALLPHVRRPGRRAAVAYGRCVADRRRARRRRQSAVRRVRRQRPADHRRTHRHAQRRQRSRQAHLWRPARLSVDRRPPRGA